MQRPRSLHLNLEGLPAEATADGPAVLRKVINNSLKDGGIVMDKIDGIECFSKVAWYIVFTTRQVRTEAKNKIIKLYEKDFVLESLEYERTRVNYTWVRLYGYPLDSDSTFLQKTMTLYGDLNSLIDEVDGRLQIKTGVKIAQFSNLKGNIPSFIHVRKHRVRTAYRGQTKTCRNCHQAGHEVKECTAGKVCKQCGKSGHTKGDCPERICFHCLRKGHEAHNCPKYAEEYPGLLEPRTTEQTTNQEETPINESGTTTTTESLDISTTKNEPAQAELTTQSPITTPLPTQAMESEGQPAIETRTSQTESTQPTPTPNPPDPQQTNASQSLNTTGATPEVDSTPKSDPATKPPSTEKWTTQDDPTIPMKTEKLATATQQQTQTKNTHPFKKPKPLDQQQKPTTKPPTISGTMSESVSTLTPGQSTSSESEEKPPLKTIKTTPPTTQTKGQEPEKPEQQGKKAEEHGKKETHSDSEANEQLWTREWGAHVYGAEDQTEAGGSQSCLNRD
ncbi:vegetative cell wall gp1-like [Paramuricea clavata]|uniref:Vegetative cell wall gp1-like n=1 Tax=Paramuricea clavata TaxID=317549 RepID=A0A7D9J885_PARCT|nr:vegetative cell wall gp1-like [Paramuricea clavata]